MRIKIWYVKVNPIKLHIKLKLSVWIVRKQYLNRYSCWFDRNINPFVSQNTKNIRQNRHDCTYLPVVQVKSKLPVRSSTQNISPQVYICSLIIAPCWIEILTISFASWSCLRVCVRICEWHCWVHIQVWVRISVWHSWVQTFCTPAFATSRSAGQAMLSACASAGFRRAVCFTVTTDHV